MDSLIGICGKDWVVMISDAAVRHSIVTVKGDEDKLLQLDDDKLLGAQGDDADRVLFTEFVQKNVALHTLRADGIKLSTHAVACWARNELAKALRQGPFQVNLLIGGRGELYTLDYLGSMQKLRYGAHGYGAHFVLGLLDRLWREDMTLEEGVELARTAATEVQKRLAIGSARWLVKAVDAQGKIVIMPPELEDKAALPAFRTFGQNQHTIMSFSNNQTYSSFARGKGAKAAASSTSPTASSPVNQAPHGVLFVTANDIETIELNAAFESKEEKRRVVGNYVVYSLGTYQGVEFCHVQLSKQGSERPGSSLPACSALIQRLKPLAIIFVGVAMGIPQDQSFKIGDVLVSTSIHNYSSLKITNGHIEDRGTTVDTSRFLTQLFQEPLRGVTVHKGLILSGPLLINDISTRNALLISTAHLKPIGFEMEASGVCTACQEANVKTEWIVVKGISDWGDGNKDQNKEARQHLAAGNAAKFVYAKKELLAHWCLQF